MHRTKPADRYALRGKIMRLESSADGAGYTAIGASAIVSALGWFSIDRWVPVSGDGSAVMVALLRTIFTLLPAIVGFWIAMRRQRDTHKAITLRLADLRSKVSEYQRVRKIEHELHTMDRMAKVAREAVKNTASSSKELLGAIEAVDEPRVKERLVERYRYHTNNVVTVLSAVAEQMEQSGRSIQLELTADDAIPILEREKLNTSRGIEHAREIMEQRGIVDGLQQLNFAAEQASKLQLELSSLKAIAPPAQENQDG
ncbi:hypothetical protein [Pseudomonas sp. CGJS7]|uniref:hypothetical protein n=1 Tax=Pseudomonas sp. CGJS7 TaxID=3109348 RepID=UPI00300BC673